MNRSQFVAMAIISVVYLIMLGSLVLAALDGNLMSVVVLATIVIVAGNMIAAMLIWGVLADILERLRSSKMTVRFYYPGQEEKTDA